MAVACAVLEWTSAQSEPAPLDRREPGESDWFEGDVSEDVDCQGAGVIITNVVAAIRTEDDDGLLSFGIITFTDTTFRVPYTVDPSQEQHMYGITVTVTLSDTRTLKYNYSLPIVPVAWLHS